MNAIKILIVEDDPIIAEDLYSLLSSQDYKVNGVAHTGTEALDLLSKREIDFALLDIHLGGSMTGIDIAEVIHDKYRIPYVFLTSFDDEETLNAAQQYAPYGYLVKPFQDRSLLTTIKMAMSNYTSNQRSKELSKEEIESLIGQQITNQEHQILIFLLSGLSYKQIAEKAFISVNTVKYHAGNIYSKCRIKGRSELAACLKK